MTVPQPEDLTCAVADSGRAARVTLAGEIDLATALRLGDVLRHAEEHSGGVILDLSDVEFIDCRGAHLLLATVRRVRARGARFTLEGVSDIVMRLLRVTGVERELQRDPAFPSERRDRRPSLRAPRLAAGPAARR